MLAVHTHPRAEAVATHRGVSKYCFAIMFGQLYLHHTYPHCKQNITKNKSSSPRYGNKHLSGLPMHDTTSRRTSFDEICHNCAPHEQNRPPRPTKQILQKYPRPNNNTYPHCKQNITKNRHTSSKLDPTPVSQYPEDSRARRPIFDGRMNLDDNISQAIKC